MSSHTYLRMFTKEGIHSYDDVLLQGRGEEGEEKELVIVPLQGGKRSPRDTQIPIWKASKWKRKEGRSGSFFHHLHHWMPGKRKAKALLLAISRPARGKKGGGKRGKKNGGLLADSWDNVGKGEKYASLPGRGRTGKRKKKEKKPAIHVISKEKNSRPQNSGRGGEKEEKKEGKGGEDFLPGTAGVEKMGGGGSRIGKETL